MSSALPLEVIAANKISKKVRIGQGKRVWIIEKPARGYHSPHMEDSSSTAVTAQSQNQIKPAKNNKARLMPRPTKP